MEANTLLVAHHIQSYEVKPLPESLAFQLHRETRGHGLEKVIHDMSMITRLTMQAMPNSPEQSRQSTYA
jgi:hypothetical protein